MRARLPSPAMIVACLALFVALGGTALAAKHYIITSKSQIKPSVVRELRGLTGPRGPAGPQGQAGPQGATVYEPTSTLREVTFFGGEITNNEQSQVVDTAGYASLRLTLECSTSAEIYRTSVAVQISADDSSWATAERYQCSHPGTTYELALASRYYKLELWTVEGPVDVTAIGRLSAS